MAAWGRRRRVHRAGVSSWARRVAARARRLRALAEHLGSRPVPVAPAALSPSSQHRRTPRAPGGPPAARGAHAGFRRVARGALSVPPT